MKETKIEPTLSMNELFVEGVYFSTRNDLIQIKNIDHQKQELHFFNISQQTNFYNIPFDRHNLVRRIR